MPNAGGRGITPFRRETVALAALNVLWRLSPPNSRIDLAIVPQNGQAVAFKEGMLLISEEVDLAALPGLIQQEWRQVLAYKHLTGKHDQQRHGHGGGATRFPYIGGASSSQKAAVETALSQMPQFMVDGVISIDFVTNLPPNVDGRETGGRIEVRKSLRGKDFERVVVHEASHAGISRFQGEAPESHRGLSSLYSEHSGRAFTKEGTQNYWQAWSKVRGEKPVTAYALSSWKEYFAETVAHYTISPAALKTRDPKAYALLSEALK